MTETVTLKRCPFCGAAPRLGRGKRHKRDGLYAKAGEWLWKPYVGCGPCKFTRAFDSVEAAAEWWNTRADKGAAAFTFTPRRELA